MIDSALIKKFIYVVCPGQVRSQDGDVHYIGYAQLVNLYHIPYDSWIAEASICHSLPGVEYRQRLIFLRPDSTGSYDLEELINKKLLELF